MTAVGHYPVIGEFQDVVGVFRASCRGTGNRCHRRGEGVKLSLYLRCLRTALHGFAAADIALSHLQLLSCRRISFTRFRCGQCQRLRSNHFTRVGTVHGSLHYLAVTGTRIQPNLGFTALQAFGEYIEITAVCGFSPAFVPGFAVLGGSGHIGGQHGIAALRKGSAQSHQRFQGTEYALRTV